LLSTSPLPPTSETEAVTSGVPVCTAPTLKEMVTCPLWPAARATGSMNPSMVAVYDVPNELETAKLEIPCGKFTTKVVSAGVF
jgi:hypothetical protein